MLYNIYILNPPVSSQRKFRAQSIPLPRNSMEIIASSAKYDQSIDLVIQFADILQENTAGHHFVVLFFV